MFPHVFYLCIQSISVPEACPIDDLDPEAIKSAYATAVSASSSAAEGSVEKASAMIEIDTYTSMARAISITL